MGHRFFDAFLVVPSGEIQEIYQWIYVLIFFVVPSRNQTWIHAWFWWCSMMFPSNFCHAVGGFSSHVCFLENSQLLLTPWHPLALGRGPAVEVSCTLNKTSAAGERVRSQTQSSQLGRLLNPAWLCKWVCLKIGSIPPQDGNRWWQWLIISIDVTIDLGVPYFWTNPNCRIL